MTSVEIALGSLERVIIPDIHAFDEHSGEPQDPTTLPVKFALGTGSTEPAESAYVLGEWLLAAASPTAAIHVGTGGALVPSGKGTFKLWIGIDGTTERPRRPVADVLVS